MSRPFRPLSILVVLLAICLFAIVGFRVGQTARATAADAAASWRSAASGSYSRARATAYGHGWQRGYHDGWRAGSTAGKTSARRAARAAASAALAVRAVAAREVARVLASTPVRWAHGVKTTRCIAVAGGLCEALGPRVTGRRCPPGSVAYPEGGVVCLPRVLLLAARLTGAAAPAALTR